MREYPEICHLYHEDSYSHDLWEYLVDYPWVNYNSAQENDNTNPYYRVEIPGTALEYLEVVAGAGCQNIAAVFDALEWQALDLAPAS